MPTRLNVLSLVNCWRVDPTNRQAAGVLLADSVPHVTLDLAAATCKIFLARAGGFEPVAKLGCEGV